MAATKQQERFEGDVKWFSSRKGFGFITPRDETKEELFVHQSEIVSKGYRTLSGGNFVEFSVSREPDGRLMASEVVFRGKSSQGGRGPCYTCGLFGHFARDCPDLRAQLSNNGVKSSNGNTNGEYVKKIECYTCRQIGHFARDCTAQLSGNNSKSNVECYNCGLFGHFARECVQARRVNGGNNGERRNDKCYTCGKIGHFSRDCRASVKN